MMRSGYCNTTAGELASEWRKSFLEACGKERHAILNQNTTPHRGCNNIEEYASVGNIGGHL
jgi:hypothetical protein